MELLDEVRLSEFDPLKYGEGIVVRVNCTDDEMGDYEVQVYRKVEDETQDRA